jgi:hypothetical protein
MLRQWDGLALPTSLKSATLGVGQKRRRVCPLSICIESMTATIKLTQRLTVSLSKLDASLYLLS